MKRTYLKMLPPQEIIELCLNFEVHVPAAIRNALWPPDIGVAIREAQSRTLTSHPVILNSPHASAVHDVAINGIHNSPPDVVPPPQPPDQTSVVRDGANSEQGFSSFAHPPAMQIPSSRYPSLSTGASLTHLTTGMSNATASIHGYQTAAHDPTGQGLPSYEAMIIQALNAMNEAEGSAPKDVFAWMANQYTLQQNFRPSASQALQKAFRKGRLEKGSNGKYRINPTWEGGPVSVIFGIHAMQGLKSIFR